MIVGIVTVVNIQLSLMVLVIMDQFLLVIKFSTGILLNFGKNFSYTDTLITVDFPLSYSSIPTVTSTAWMNFNEWNNSSQSVNGFQLFHSVDTVTINNFSCKDNPRNWFAIGH